MWLTLCTVQSVCTGDLTLAEVLYSELAVRWCTVVEVYSSVYTPPGLHWPRLLRPCQRLHHVGQCGHSGLSRHNKQQSPFKANTSHAPDRPTSYHQISRPLPSSPTGVFSGKYGKNILENCNFILNLLN